MMKVTIKLTIYKKKMGHKNYVRLDLQVEVLYVKYNIKK